MRSSARFDPRAILAHLRALPFVERANLRSSRAEPLEDGRLTLHTPRGLHELAVSLKEAPLTRSVAANLITVLSGRTDRPWIVFSPHVTGPVGQFLIAHGIAYADVVGNCHLALGKEYLVHIEGRRPPRSPGEGRGLGAQSYQVLFALLAKPELANAPIRTLADRAGVRKTTVARLLLRLEEERLLVRDRGGRRMTQPTALLDRWLVGYTDKLRPRLLLGRYRALQKSPLELEKHVESSLDAGEAWAWGGAAAAYRLAQHYRGEETILHASAVPSHLQEAVGLLPSAAGPVTILGLPGPLALDGPEPHLAHPLLIYTELLVEGGERAQEAAGEIRVRYLPWLD